MIERCNAMRKRIPYAYWLLYDAVMAPLVVWGLVRFSLVFVVGLVPLAVAVFFDITEAIVKDGRRA